MKSKSYQISYLLRHNPEDLKMDKNGWVFISDLVQKIEITLDELEQIVETNDKKRFVFDESGTKIRANQGHSIKVDVELKAKIPPKYLYHGTSFEKVKSIKKKGLLKMNRNHVHLSKDSKTAHNVAKRHCKNSDPIIFKIDTYPMIVDEIKFYESANGVWLVDHVPPKYLK